MTVKVWIIMKLGSGGKRESSGAYLDEMTARYNASLLIGMPNGPLITLENYDILDWSDELNTAATASVKTIQVSTVEPTENTYKIGS